MSGFGECQDCGNAVERVGWDDLCFACQESEKAELIDDGEECEEQEARWQRMDEEDAFLYGAENEIRGAGSGSRPDSPVAPDGPTMPPETRDA